jgi:hypothetical protein
MITTKMVKYWVNDMQKKEIIQDYKDLANGKYDVNLLKKDIILAWNERRDNE